MALKSQLLMLLISGVLSLTEKGLWISEPIKNISCLEKEKIDWLYISGFINNGTIDNSAQRNLELTKLIQSKRRLFINPTMKLHENLIAMNLCNELIKPLNERFHLYIAVYNNTISWSITNRINREFIKKLYRAILDASHCFESVSFISRRTDWEDLFGDNFTEFKESVLIWNRSDVKSCDKSGFDSFGGWNRPDGIIFAHHKYLCNNYYDESCFVT